MANDEQVERPSRWAVAVDLTARPGFAARFLTRLQTQAADSRREPGCLQFDVCVDPSDEHRLFLFEIYVDQEAFAGHLATPHFADFDAVTREWVSSKRVTQWRLVLP